MLGQLARSLPRAASLQITEDTLDFMAAALSDLTVEEINRAGTRAVLQCRFMPTVAELRELAGRSLARAADQPKIASAATLAALREWAEGNEGSIHRDANGQANAWRSLDGEPVDVPASVRESVDGIGGIERLFYALHRPKEWQFFAREFREFQENAAPIAQARAQLTAAPQLALPPVQNQESVN